MVKEATWAMCYQCRFFTPKENTLEGICTIKNAVKYKSAYCTKEEGFELKDGADITPSCAYPYYDC